MIISKETLTVIRNFSNINGSFLFQPGNRICTISESRDVMAEAIVPETFPTTFGIYDLGEFLSVLSIYDNVDMEFTQMNVDGSSVKCVNISGGNDSSIKYFPAGEGLVKVPPNSIHFPKPDISFELSTSNLAMIQKVSSALKTSDVTVEGKDGKLSITVSDKKNSTSNLYSLSLGNTDLVFKANFKTEKMKFLPGDYEVSISRIMVSKFVSKSGATPLTYFVALETDSFFE